MPFTHLPTRPDPCSRSTPASLPGNQGPEYLEKVWRSPLASEDLIKTDWSAHDSQARGAPTTSRAHPGSHRSLSHDNLERDPYFLSFYFLFFVIFFGFAGRNSQ